MFTFCTIPTSEVEIPEQDRYTMRTPKVSRISAGTARVRRDHKCISVE